MIKRILFIVACVSLFCGCADRRAPSSALQNKVNAFATFQIGSPYMEGLTDNGKEVLNLFRLAADEVDKIYWQQVFGDKNEMLSLPDGPAKDYAMINYGPWDRMDNNEPFVGGYGPRPAGANFYPADMTKEEFDAMPDSAKFSPYTLIRRAEDGSLKAVWYHDAYKESIDKIARYLEGAATMTIKESVRNYLLKRVEALRTDNYYESDLAWMDMNDSKIDLVIGPIEDYEDGINGLKAAYECFILLKDLKRTEELTKYISMLPDLQKSLPCPPEYKTFVPGTESDMFVYDAIYYSGDANAGGKTIAINLPNDPKVHAEKGTRRLQLRNVIKAKFDKIVYPIGSILIEPEQQRYLSADAFFWNVTFHEVAHGLGVKETVNGLGPVDKALGNESSVWEEAKADILGLYMVCNLIDKGEIPVISKESAITTYITSLVRSVRFGAGEAHGRANMMCYNFLKENGAFERNKDGRYHINFDKVPAVVEAWANLILTTQATGNYMFAKEYDTNHAVVPEALSADIANVNRGGVPVDIRFEFVW
ncbi:MAG: Zn-dependent hydrolase [Bacteroidales bacterium]|nr:Zn-dependent hydrolase [Bacteroidales bacterium]